MSNDRIKTEKTWDKLLEQMMPFFWGQPLRLVIDLTPYEEHAQVIYIGLLQHSRVLPLAWKVMPGQEKWDQGLWNCIGELFQRLAPHIGETDCTIIGVSRVWMLSNGAIVSAVQVVLPVSHLWATYL